MPSLIFNESLVGFDMVPAAHCVRRDNIVAVYEQSSGIYDIGEVIDEWSDPYYIAYTITSPLVRRPSMMLYLMDVEINDDVVTEMIEELQQQVATFHWTGPNHPNTTTLLFPQ